MEAIQYTFKRIEKKYVLTEKKAEQVMARLEPYMTQDHYGRHTIRNIYYDTPDYMLIRHSLSKPVYKEKFRLRGYSSSENECLTFAELKKKYRGVVYKRRVAGTGDEIAQLLGGGWLEREDAQIQREIHWFLNTWRLQPKVFISYERDAFFCPDDPLLRLTFDRQIRWRGDRLLLSADDAGELILPENPVIMEIKIANAAPLWLTRMLSELSIYPTGFSKYGACFLHHIAPSFETGERN